MREREIKIRKERGREIDREIDRERQTEIYKIGERLGEMKRDKVLKRQRL